MATSKVWPFQRGQKRLPKLIIHSNKVNLTAHAERGSLRTLKAAVQKALASSEAFLLHDSYDTASESGQLPIAQCWAVVRASVGGHTEVVRYFVDNYSDIVSAGSPAEPVLRTKPKQLPNCCKQGKSWHRHSPPPIALHWAASTGNIDILKILISAGASVEWRDELDRTPLHWAAYFRREKAVKYLISCGAQVNVCNLHGITPLMDCLKGVPFHNQLETVQLLTGKGADIGTTTTEGATVFHIISVLPPDESCKLLLMLVQCDQHKALSLLFDVPVTPRYILLPALLYAAQENKREFVECVVSQFRCYPRLQADALLGLSTHCTQVENIRKLWTRAFHIREENNVRVESLSCTGGYGNQREVVSWEEARQILDVRDGGSITDIGRENLYYQLAMMQERIFGLGNPHVVEFLWSSASTLCYSGQLKMSEQMYLRGLELLIVCLSSKKYAIDLCISTSQPQNEISYMIRCGYVPEFSRYVQLYLDALLLISEVAGNESDSQFQRDRLAEFCNYLAQTAFLMLCTWAYFVYKNYSRSENESIQSEIADLGQQLLKRASFVLCYSLVEVSTKTTEWVKTEERLNYKRFIQKALLSWAKLACAFDAMDSNGQRPLHLLFVGTNPDSILLKILLDNGAHIDAVNSSQKKAIGVFHDYQRPSSLPDVEPLLIPPSPLSLTCLAAKAVIATQIPYQEMENVPPRVKRLASLHDSNAPRGQFVHTTCFLPPVVNLSLLP